MLKGNATQITCSSHILGVSRMSETLIHLSPKQWTIVRLFWICTAKSLDDRVTGCNKKESLYFCGHKDQHIPQGRWKISFFFYPRETIINTFSVCESSCSVSSHAGVNNQPENGLCLIKVSYIFEQVFGPQLLPLPHPNYYILYSRTRPSPCLLLVTGWYIIASVFYNTK